MTSCAFKRPQVPAAPRARSPRIPLALSFWVPGLPHAWQRVVPVHGRPYNPPALVAWEATVRLFARQAMVLQEQNITSAPVLLTALFVFPVSKSWYLKNGKLSAEGKKWAWGGSLYHGKDPDASNLLKGVEDAMIGVVYDDDNQIYLARPEKSFGAVPGVRIEVRTP